VSSADEFSTPHLDAWARRQAYNEARQKLERFFANPGERKLILSNTELNAYLAGSPELRFFNHGAVVVLNQDSADVYCSLPLNLPFVSRKYFNYTVHLGPSMRGEGFELNVLRIDREGKALGPTELRQFQIVAIPSFEKMLSIWNRLQTDRSVREVRIENGNLILAR
jgi:hypothetical protein